MTIRQFKFTGSNDIVGSTGTISLNGVQVLNGEFTGDSSAGSYLFAGSVDVDDALAVNQEILIPTVITVTSGQIHVALTEWNYAVVPNPIYTSEQLAILNDPNVSKEDKSLIINPLANPPFSPAEQTFLLSTDPADQLEQNQMLKDHGVLFVVQDPTVFDWGLTPEEDACNRVNVLLDGVEPAGANTNVGLLVTEGQTLTYNSIVFAANLY